MRIVTNFAIYFLIWWVVLFAVLPWGIHNDRGEGAAVRGTDPGAPTVPNLGQKVLWTTAVSAAFFVVGKSLFVSRILTLDVLGAALTSVVRLNF